MRTITVEAPEKTCYLREWNKSEQCPLIHKTTSGSMIGGFYWTCPHRGLVLEDSLYLLKPTKPCRDAEVKK